MPRRQVQLAEVLGTTQRAALADMHKITAGIVVGYHPSVAPSGGVPGTPASVDVQVAIHDVREDDDGALESEPFPILPEVPLALLKLGGFSIRAQAQKGDRVLLLSYDLDPTKHVLTGEAEDPTFPARHTGSFWIAVPFDITDPGALEDPGSDLVLGIPGGTELRLNPSSILLGRNATDYVALSTLVAAELAKIALTLTPMVAAFNVPAAPMSSLGTGMVPPYAPGSVAATLTKAK